MMHVENFLKLHANKAFSYEELMTSTELIKSAVKRQIKKLWKEGKIVKMKRLEYRTVGGKPHKVQIAYFMWDRKVATAILPRKEANKE